MEGQIVCVWGVGGYKQLDIVSSINKDRIVQGNNCAKL